MDLMHIKAEFEAGRLNEAVAEPSEEGKGWRLLLYGDDHEKAILLSLIHI